jgi:hypothetical protein
LTGGTAHSIVNNDLLAVECNAQVEEGVAIAALLATALLAKL